MNEDLENGQEQEELNEGDQLDPELEAEARKMGWVPQPEFKGKKDKWIPAEDYVERGRHVIPIMQATNERLRNEVLTTGKKLGTLEQQMAEQTSVIDKLTKRLAQQTKRDLAIEKRSITEQISEAREDKNTELEFQLVGRLEDIKTQEKEIEEELKAPEKKSTDTDSGNGRKGYSPEMNEWLAANPWYGEDKKKTKAYERLAEDLRDEGETAVGRDFFEILDQEYAARNPDSNKSTKNTPVNKAESGNSRGSGPAGGSGPAAKSWASLPKEAKEACLEFSNNLVGPGKRYKTLDDWKKQYANDYFSE